MSANESALSPSYSVRIHEAAHFGLLEDWSAVEIQMVSVVHDCLNIQVSPLDAKRKLEAYHPGR